LAGVIFEMVGDKTVTQDILQEAFVKIWKNIDSYDDTKGRLYTWMRRIAYNLTLDYLKSSQHQFDKKVVADADGVVEVAIANPVLSRLDSKDFKQKLDRLDAKQRRIIDMSYYQGYTQDEIAVALDMPVGTVKTKIRSAIIELRKIFT
jgi:RNA polymerase sigma factor (sigma-70 family)